MVPNADAIPAWEGDAGEVLAVTSVRMRAQVLTPMPGIEVVILRRGGRPPRDFDPTAIFIAQATECEQLFCQFQEHDPAAVAPTTTPVCSPQRCDTAHGGLQPERVPIGTASALRRCSRPSLPMPMPPHCRQAFAAVARWRRPVSISSRGRAAGSFGTRVECHYLEDFVGVGWEMRRVSLSVAGPQDHRVSLAGRAHSLLHCRGSVAVCRSGSMPHAARCKTLASRPRARASLGRLRPLLCGATTGAFGNALRPSCVIVLMTAQAIMSEKSIILFLSFNMH
jgi:hypothetical protein